MYLRLIPMLLCGLTVGSAYAEDCERTAYLYLVAASLRDKGWDQQKAVMSVPSIATTASDQNMLRAGILTAYTIWPEVDKVGIRDMGREACETENAKQAIVPSQPVKPEGLVQFRETDGKQSIVGKWYCIGGGSNGYESEYFSDGSTTSIFSQNSTWKGTWSLDESYLTTNRHERIFQGETTIEDSQMKVKVAFIPKNATFKVLNNSTVMCEHRNGKSAS
ncbi:hypothetical protein [Pseudomonas sp. Marseille-Q5115]|uniref:hypothetical protein n=1 Tax=Pseudomonas sp. Marseille-Q5115 TaxID=2866593 RepID=UPI001CE3D8A6|nr:hypothetical protein [Pseudomonas sp. Marseille-Q5115]